VINVRYEARSSGFKIYALVAIITSLSFGLMHFGYDPSLLLDKSIILPRLGAHFEFGLMLCIIFWFLPRLGVLTIIHSLSNLFSILKDASELGL
jgi:membrane protease YdiL (CAAX protease family)